MSLVVIVLGCISIATAHINELANEEEVTSYLKQYGYLDDDNALSLANTTTVFKDAVLLFQEYFQLPGDGILNNVTLQLMRRPRCGLPDIPHHMHDAQRWPKTHLTWNFHLGDQNMIIVTEAAFALWAEHSSLTFERKTINPDIIISFRRGVHTLVHSDYVCPSKLDGPGNTLAHAFYPTGSPDGVSEVHIDSEEQWHISLTKNPSNATSLLQTLTHEIGHSLGLPHSTRNESVMYPYAPAGSGFFPLKLSIEDILAIQQLYGKRKTRRETTTTMTTTTIINEPNDDTDLCDVKYVDSVLILDHRIFIAYKHQIWMIDINDKTYSKPLLIKDILDYLPDDFIHLQAVYQRPSGDIVMFVNDLVYVISYPGFKQVENRPKTFADLRLPPNTKINAAINTNKGRTFIIFNDVNVAELDECSMRVKTFHPLQTIFPGIPPTITSAFRYTDGNLYFMDKRQQFYKFNEFYQTIVSAEKFDFNVIGIECPKQGILLQLRELLNRLIKPT